MVSHSIGSSDDKSASPKNSASTQLPAQQRLRSLDAYRGLIMITLAFNGFGLAATARNMLRDYPDSTLWQAVYHHFEHVEWTGAGYWDMIQPSFMFMVGAAMAFSYGKRKEMGQSWPSMFLHAVVRSVILILLGIFLISNWSNSTNWSLMNVLTQIGLGYVFLFLLWGRPFWLQVIAAVVILAGTWYWYDQFPTDGINLETGAPAVGVTKEWAQENLTGVNSKWHKNANVGHDVDLWLLNLPRRAWGAFPRFPKPDYFVFNRGGYQTINFIPSLATMLFGLMCGELLRSSRSAGQKLTILIVAGTLGIIAGYGLDLAGVCPLVKRIWTPSWTLFSTGWCCLILAMLFGIIDVAGWKWWSFPLVVVGMNSIAIYCMGQLLKPWAEKTYKIHLGQNIFELSGSLAPYEPMLKFTMIGLMFWLICLWLYHRKLFIRI